MSLLDRSVEFLRSPNGFRSEIIGTFAGYSGAVALSLAEVEPTWLSRSPLVVSVLCYVALADNIINGQQPEQHDTGQQG